jgi:hypothetical protein
MPADRSRVFAFTPTGGIASRMQRKETTRQRLRTDHRVVWLACLLPAALTTLLVTAGTAAAAVETKVFEFDELAPGTRIVEQYKGYVVFEEATKVGFEHGSEPKDNVVADAANCLGPVTRETSKTSSPPIFASNYCGQEFGPAGTFAVLTSYAKAVTAYVGDAEVEGIAFRLDAYDAEHHLLGHSEATASSASVDTPIEFEAPSYEIAYFALYRTNSTTQSFTVGFDNLSLDIGGASPDITLSASASGEIAQGGSIKHTVTVFRDNGSEGNVRLKAAGLPSGVSASFEPEVLTGTESTSTLTLSAKTNAPLAEASGTIKAEPETVKAGSVTRKVALDVAVVAPFSVYVGNASNIPAYTTVQLPPCSSASVVVRTMLQPGFPGPVDLALSSAGPPPDLSAASLEHEHVETSEFDIAGVNEQRLRITRNGNGPASGTFSVQVAGTSGPFSEPPATVLVERAAPTITALTPLKGHTPQALSPGTEVTLQGEGFCPNTTVQFGNGSAVVPAGSINGSGTSLKASVPRLATSGTVAVTSGGASANAPSAMTIDSYRNVNGYQFHNYNPFITFSQMTEAFGPEQTEIKLDLCWPFGCDVKFPSPIALIVQLIADESLKSGACFGMSLSSQRLLEGYRQFNEFPPGSANSVFGLAEGEQPSPALMDFINSRHVQQLSTEFLTHALSAETSQGTAGGVSMSKSVYEEIEGAFANHEYPLIALEEGARGHVVVAYDLEGSPGDYYIDVYDSNLPFNSGGSEDGEGQASHHEGNVYSSRVHVGSDGEWTLPSTGISGGVTGLFVTDPGGFPLRPSMIGGPGPIGFLFTSNSGSGSPSSTVSQLEDSSGHKLLTPSGEPNTDPATRLAAAEFGPLVGATARASAAVSTASQGIIVSTTERALKETVTGASSGGDTHTLVGPGFAAQVTTKAGKGVKDTLSLSPTLPQVTFSSKAAHKPLSLKLVDGLSKEAHVAQVSTTSFGGHGDELRLTHSGNGLLFAHHGAATTFSITLSAAGRKGAKTFHSGPMHIGRGASATIAAIHWSNLAGATLSLRVGRRTVRVRNHQHIARLARVRALRARKTAKGVVLKISAALRRLPKHSKLAFAWAIRRGRHVVATHARLTSAKVRSASYTFKPPKRGAYSLTATVAVISTSGLATTSSKATRRLTFRYR